MIIPHLVFLLQNFLQSAFLESLIINVAMHGVNVS